MNKKSLIIASIFVLSCANYSHAKKNNTGINNTNTIDSQIAEIDPNAVDPAGTNAAVNAKTQTAAVPDNITTVRQNVSVEKQIEMNTVNFIKFKVKPQEIFIPNPKIADVDMLDDTSLYLMGITPGVTNLIAHDKNGDVIADYTIKVTHPLKQMRQAIMEVYPELDISLTSIDASVIVRGKVESPEVASDVIDIVSRFVKASNVINKLTINTATQVMLKVKIAEVSRTLTKSLGINWRALSIGNSHSAMTYGFASANAKGAVFPVFDPDLGKFHKALYSSEGEVFSKGVTGGGEWLIHSGGTHGGLSGIIEALANESFASVLAEPTLVTLSGKTATFKSGGEQGYSVKQESSDSNTVEFKEWGTSIEFTPIVLSEDRINITVKPVVSTVSFGQSNAEGGDGTPALSTKEAQTTVELGSGQSLAIAGLLQTSKDTASIETPLLADLPIIGSMFRTSAVKSDEKEIIIIITPYIVKPSSKQLKTPVDMTPRVVSPLESIFARRFHGQKVKSAAGFSIK